MTPMLLEENTQKRRGQLSCRLSTPTPRVQDCLARWGAGLSSPRDPLPLRSKQPPPSPAFCSKGPRTEHRHLWPWLPVQTQSCRGVGRVDTAQRHHRHADVEPLEASVAEGRPGKLFLLM